MSIVSVQKKFKNVDPHQKWCFLGKFLRFFGNPSKILIEAKMFLTQKSILEIDVRTKHYNEHLDEIYGKFKRKYPAHGNNLYRLYSQIELLLEKIFYRKEAIKMNQPSTSKA